MFTIFRNALAHYRGQITRLSLAAFSLVMAGFMTPLRLRR
jgi:hypothetical protein